MLADESVLPPQSGVDSVLPLVQEQCSASKPSFIVSSGPPKLTSKGLLSRHVGILVPVVVAANTATE